MRMHVLVNVRAMIVRARALKWPWGVANGYQSRSALRDRSAETK